MTNIFTNISFKRWNLSGCLFRARYDNLPSTSVGATKAKRGTLSLCPVNFQWAIHYACCCSGERTIIMAKSVNAHSAKAAARKLNAFSLRNSDLPVAYDDNTHPPFRQNQKLSAQFKPSLRIVDSLLRFASISRAHPTDFHHFALHAHKRASVKWNAANRITLRCTNANCARHIIDFGSAIESNVFWSDAECRHFNLMTLHLQYASFGWMLRMLRNAVCRIAKYACGRVNAIFSLCWAASASWIEFPIKLAGNCFCIVLWWLRKCNGIFS